MTRIARIVVPGLPHHVTQRGNRGQQVFLQADDYGIYKDLLAQSCRRFGVEIWAYCLMPNHVHLIATPQDETGLAMAMGRAHRLYAGYFNARARQTGALFQGRYGSVALDEAHLMTAARYVALNPVRANLATRAQDWPYASVLAHLAGQDDGLVVVKPLLERAPDFAALLRTAADAADFAALRNSELIGRPLGGADFIAAIEAALARKVTPGKRGPKPRSAGRKKKRLRGKLKRV